MATAKKSSDKVGYRKPPKSSRFKKGQSGNPRGRPKGTRNFGTDVKEMLAMPVPVERDGGRKTTISTQQAGLLRLREKALKGDARALDRLLALGQVHSETMNGGGEYLTPDERAILELFRARMRLRTADEEIQANPTALTEGDDQ